MQTVIKVSSNLSSKRILVHSTVIIIFQRREANADNETTQTMLMSPLEDTAVVNAKNSSSPKQNNNCEQKLGQDEPKLLAAWFTRSCCYEAPNTFVLYCIVFYLTDKYPCVFFFKCALIIFTRITMRNGSVNWNDGMNEHFEVKTQQQSDKFLYFQIISDCYGFIRPKEWEMTKWTSNTNERCTLKIEVTEVPNIHEFYNSSFSLS